MAAPARSKAFGWIRLWEDRAGIRADAVAARGRRSQLQERQESRETQEDQERQEAQERQNTAPDRRNSHKDSDSTDGAAHFTPLRSPALLEAAVDHEYVRPGIRGILSSSRVLACALISALSGFLVGYDQGVVRVILGLRQFSESSRVESSAIDDCACWRGTLTAIIIELGAIVGALIPGWSADKYSRKRTFVIAVATFVIGNALQISICNSLILLVFARFMTGIGLGMLSMVAPLYISEISPAEIRGTLLVLVELAIVGGILAGFWIGFGTRHMKNEWSWRLPLMLQMLPALVLGSGACVTPNSPRWLVAECKDEDALAVLGSLRQLPEDDLKVQKEWTEIRAEIICHQEISRERHPKLQEDSSLVKFKLDFALWIDCFRPGCQNRTIIGISLMFFQQFIGTKALLYYSNTLFKGVGFDGELGLIMFGILCGCQFIGVLSSLFTMDWYGRKKLLMWGSALMCICTIIITALVGKYSSDWQSSKGAAWACAAFLSLFMVVFGATWGPVPWAMTAEIFPSSLRAKGIAISICCNWLTGLLLTLYIPHFIENATWKALLFFAFFCLLSGVWTYLYVHETNNFTLEEMDLVFKDAADNAAEEDRRQRIRRNLDSSDTASPLRLPRGSV